MKPDKGQHVFHYNRYLHLLLYEFQEILFEAASIKRVEHHTRFQFLFDVKLKLIGEFAMKEKVLILGLSKSGIAAAKFANKQGYDVFITESKPLDKVKEECKSKVEELKNLGIKIEYI